MNGLNKKKIIQ